MTQDCSCNDVKIAGKQDAIERALQAFEDKTRGVPQAHIAAQLIAEIRASIDAAVPAAEETPAQVLTALVDFQVTYGKNALDPKGMPGNEHYRDLLVKLVARARAALHL